MFHRCVPGAAASVPLLRFAAVIGSVVALLLPAGGASFAEQVNVPPPVSHKGQWVLWGKNPVIEAPALNPHYFYIYPNAVLIDAANNKGYLLAHIREDKDSDGLVEPSDDRNIHLFTFSPETPDSVAHEGTLLTATGRAEEENAGGILEASTVVLGNTVYVYYTSWIGSNNTLLATAKLDDMMGTITRKTVVFPGVALEVAYGNGLFCGISKGTSVDLYSSLDGIHWKPIRRPLFNDGIDVDRGRDLKILAEKLLWFTYRDTNLPTMGITGRVFDLRSSALREKRLPMAVIPTKTTPPLYDKGVDSPAVFTHGGEWYMYIGGMTHHDSRAGGSNDTKVLLFKWQEHAVGKNGTPAMCKKKRGGNQSQKK